MYSIFFLGIVVGGTFYLSSAGYSLITALPLALLCCIIPPAIFGFVGGTLPDGVWRVVRTPGAVLFAILALLLLAQL